MLRKIGDPMKEWFIRFAPLILFSVSASVWLTFLLFIKILGLKIIIFVILSHLLLLLYCGILIRKLSLKANIDDLTGICNRRYFFYKISEFLKNKSPVSLMIVDIDDFKRINDTYGHSAGDEVLKQFASILKNITRSYDIVARLGGDEFAIVMPQTRMENVYKMAERIKRSIEEHVFMAGCAAEKISVSIGIGTAILPCDIDFLINRADSALYKAKKIKNAIVAYE